MVWGFKGCKLTSAISIVIPFYNKEPYIISTLQALTAQMSSADEIIVVDDQSTDNGPYIARAFFETVPAYGRVVTLPRNSGPATARNWGARISKNPYLLFFDADDIPLPPLLQTLRSVIELNPSATIFAYHIARQARGEKPIYTDRVGKISTDIRPLHAFAIDSLEGKMLLHPSCTLITRDAFFQADGGFQEGLRYCEDPELWVRLSSIHSVIEIHETLAIYRDVPGSLSYGLRGIVGSVNAYVETLKKLAAQYGTVYLQLARSMLFKNLVFSRASGASRLEAARQLSKYRPVLGMKIYLLLNCVNLFPSVIFQRVLELRSEIASRASK